MSVIGGYAVDRTPFYGLKAPPEVKKLVHLLSTADRSKTFRKVLKIVVQQVESGAESRDELRGLESEAFPQEHVRSLYAGARWVLVAALRQPGLKTEVVREDLKQIKFPEELLGDVCAAVSGARRTRLVQGRRARLPQLQTLRWRVDVIISNSTLHRMMEPSIVVEMTLTDGQIKRFEVPVSKFHELRYSVAYVMKEMEELEKRNILKLE